MIFTPTPLAGGWVVDLERHADERGFFARTWCRHEFEEHGLDPAVVQCNLSHNPRRGTLRGLHWQTPPHAEVKLVRCSRGAIWDVMVDLRPDSATYTRHFGAELTEANGRALYIPEGFAHGFVTLVDDSDVVYQMSALYEPSAGRGARWNDPAFGIAWPVREPILNPRDASYPDFVPERRP
ncbi:MAG TPA: dTDP-4-dehydrorhamnose 3,5-epimerase [Gemmatimonadales bacterium]|nr:dTDP-4-dehydrorhamnose 3,5-epimerase [Gemmatimonadales bacterium]